MRTLATYIEEIVEPTFSDFENDKTPRRAFLAAVEIFHAIDRASEDLGRRGAGNLRKEWGYISSAFKLVDIVAHRFKHVRSTEEPLPRQLQDGTNQWGKITYGGVLSRMTMYEFSFTMRDAIRFIKEQSATG
jgi:hypothetical protein